MYLNARKIFHLIDEQVPTEGVQHIHQLCQVLQASVYDNGFELIWLGKRVDHPLLKVATLLGIPVTYMEAQNELRETLKSSRCLLVTHSDSTAVTGRLAALFTDTPIVTTHYGNKAATSRSAWTERMERLTTPFSTRTICVGVRGGCPAPSHAEWVPDCVEVPPFPSLLGREIAFVGNLSPENQPTCFAAITGEIALRWPVTVYGKGPLHRALEDAHPCIEFRSELNQTHQWGRIGLLCITGNDNEISGRVLEAMAHGVPVIGFKTGVLAELITHNVNGWLIEPGDNEAFSAQLTAWLGMGALEKRALSYEAYARVRDHFSTQAVLPRILRTYAEATAEFDRQPLTTNRLNESA